MESKLIRYTTYGNRHPTLLKDLLMISQVKTILLAIIGKSPSPARASISSEIERLFLLSKVKLGEEVCVDLKLLKLLSQWLVFSPFRVYDWQVPQLTPMSAVDKDFLVHVC